MFNHRCKIRVSDQGIVEVVDPTIDDLSFLQSIDSDYQIKTEPLSGFKHPRFITLRKWHIPVLKKDLIKSDKSKLWDLHEQAMKRIKKYGYEDIHFISDDHATLLDLKIEMSRRELICCTLCGNNCGTNRINGIKGLCGLSTEAYVNNIFIHIAEEASINPSLLLEIDGCGMRCRFCQKSELLKNNSTILLDANIWNYLPKEGYRSLTFIGGNPDESLYSILRFLFHATDDFNLPVVWNSHGYGNIVAYKILEGVVDAYVPDLKYSNDDCAHKWSGIKGYVETAHKSIQQMINQGLPVIVRMLILPGHTDCCHIPSIEWLSRYRDFVTLSIMDQYSPDFKIIQEDGEMVFRPKRSEVGRVLREAKKAGLKLF